MLRYDIEKKLCTVVEKLGNFAVKSQIAVATEYTEEIGEKTVLPTACKSWKPFVAPHTIFENNKYYWFKATFEVEEHAGEKAYFCIDTHLAGGEDSGTIRPQGLLYLNGEVAQGIDINHTDVFVKAGKYEMYLLFYTHEFAHSFPLHFSVKYVDEKIRSAYYDFLLPRDALRLVKQRSNEFVLASTAIERAINLLDFRKEYSSEFYDSLEKATAYLSEHYYGKLCGSEQIVNCIGHTHIDVAWLWTLEHTRDKVERSFSTVLRLMDEYPDYKFMSSQPQLYAFLKERNPKLYEKVKEKIKEGRWEVEGSMWLEADCNLTSGESLVRQIVHGKKFALEEFGVECRTVWEPDVFGYSAALPQIMKKSGVDRFVTAKIGWNDTNRMPYDTFVWQGIDGSEVFSFLLSTCNCDPRIEKYDETYTTYVAFMSAAQTLGTWNRYEPKEFNNVTMMTYGWGDGGGGPTREMLEQEKRLSYGLPGLPKTRISTVKESLDEIEKNFFTNAKELKRYPKWSGEIYFEYHRGTLTSVPRIKYNNRKGEFALQNTELCRTIADNLCEFEYPYAEMDKDWKTLLLNQFHDILPGSSIEGVYLESDKQYKELFKTQSTLTNEALDKITENLQTDGGVFVFNPNGFTANGTLVVGGETRIVKDIPALGYKVVTLDKSQNTVKIGEKTLENNAYKLVFDETGAIISLWDKRYNREVAKAGEKLNELRVYEDMPYQYDNWEMSPYYKQKEWILDGKANFEPIVDGDRAGFKITKKYYNSTICQEVYLYGDGIDRIDFVTNIDWKEKRQLLKARFPFNLLVNKATYDIQFGSIERNTCANTSWDAAKFEVAAQKWVDFSENNYGVSLLNDCKYGFGAEESTLSITLLKSGSFPYDGASDDIPECVYSLYPHGGDFRQGGTIESAYVLNRGMQGKKVEKSVGVLCDEYSFVQCDTAGVYVETVKNADDKDGVVLRLYEAFKETKTVALQVDKKFQKAYICDMLEREEAELSLQDGKLEFTIKPFEIITVKLK